MINFNPSDVTVIPASEVDPKILSEYYQRTFPHRKQSLPKIWEWLNNSTFYNNEIPYVLRHNNELIGHVGLRPVVLNINQQNYRAGWPIDLRVDPRFQNCGLGKILMNKLANYSKIHLGFPNEKSYSLLKKLGWTDSGCVYTHFFPIRVLDHPRFIRSIPRPVRTIINTVTKPYFTLKYKRYNKPEFQIKEINSSAIDEFILQRNLNDAGYHETNMIFPVRDLKFLEWRILNSPNRHNYRLLTTNEGLAILLLNNNRGRYIDILSVSNSLNLTNVVNIVACVCSYASENNFSYVRICSSDKFLDDLFKKTFGSFKKKYNFIYYSMDKDLDIHLSKYRWLWELIDSDFEYMEPITKL